MHHEISEMLRQAEIFDAEIWTMDVLAATDGNPNHVQGDLFRANLQANMFDFIIVPDCGGIWFSAQNSPDPSAIDGLLTKLYEVRGLVKIGVAVSKLTNQHLEKAVREMAFMAIPISLQPHPAFVSPDEATRQSLFVCPSYEI